jgi:uncharacterized protein (TIGR00296 family)
MDDMPGLIISEECEYSIDEYKELCVYAFDVVLSSVNREKSDLIFPKKFEDKQYPIFVTWSTGKEKNLRGCIGTFQHEDLQKNLLTYSYMAAFKDSRFKPISAKEVSFLHCGVSLLYKFEEAADAFDWEVGKHGITIDFFGDYNKKHHATFLPEVAGDRNWTKKATLKQLIQKAGYNGKLENVTPKIKLTRYQSIKVGIHYDDYLQLKK